jgi:hypothetical protein
LYGGVGNGEGAVAGHGASALDSVPQAPMMIAKMTAAGRSPPRRMTVT